MSKSQSARVSAPSKTKSVIIGLIIPVSLILLWEGASQFGLLNKFFFPAPSQISLAAVRDLADGSLALDFLMTVSRIFIGFAIVLDLTNGPGGLFSTSWSPWFFFIFFGFTCFFFNLLIKFGFLQLQVNHL